MRNSLIKNERIMTNYSLVPRLFHTASDGKLGGGLGVRLNKLWMVYTHTHTHTHNLCCVVGEEPPGRPEAPWTVFCSGINYMKHNKNVMSYK